MTMHESPELNPQIEPPHGADAGGHHRGRASLDMPELLRSALVGYEVSLERLSAAVVSYVEELKAAGMTVAQVVPEVRRFLSVMPRWTQPLDGVLPADMTVVDRAVQWAIEAFYEKEGPGDQSSVA